MVMVGFASQFHLTNRSIPSQSLKTYETATLHYCVVFLTSSAMLLVKPRQLLVEKFWGNFVLWRWGAPEIISQTDNIILLQIGAHLNLNDAERLIR